MEYPQEVLTSRDQCRIPVLHFVVTYYTGSGVDVIWDAIPFETPVVPAKAGIQFVGNAFPKVCGLDSRFRGNDGDFQPPYPANDTTTLGEVAKGKIKPELEQAPGAWRCALF
jgi:hypothetical protein